MCVFSQGFRGKHSVCLQAFASSMAHVWNGHRSCKCTGDIHKLRLQRGYKFFCKTWWTHIYIRKWLKPLLVRSSRTIRIFRICEGMILSKTLGIHKHLNVPISLNRWILLYKRQCAQWLMIALESNQPQNRSHLLHLPVVQSWAGPLSASVCKMGVMVWSTP